MNRAEYLNLDEVRCFTQWLSDQLKDDASLRHQYVTRRLPQTHFFFNRLSEAFASYTYRFKVRLPRSTVHEEGASYKENSSTLAKLRRGLRQTFCRADSDREFRDWAKATLKWGGVLNRGNREWFENQRDARSDLTTIDTSQDSFNPLRYNAGLSKIYSLLVDGLIIYDSRVAAALTWLVVVWCREVKKKSTPDKLNFNIPASRTRELVRDPSCLTFRFSKMTYDCPATYALWNIRASWILQRALDLSKKSKTVFHKQEDSLRALEAALFMWGYDLSESCPWALGDA